MRDKEINKEKAGVDKQCDGDLFDAYNFCCPEEGRKGCAGENQKLVLHSTQGNGAVFLCHVLAGGALYIVIG